MKEGGLLSLPELQLVVPPRCALQDHASPAVPTTPLLLLNLRHRPGKPPLELGPLDKGKLPGEPGELGEPGEPLLPLEAIHITHPSACNAAVLSASVEQCVCVLVHGRGCGRAA